MDRLKGKVVFLTGGGGVLGRASAMLFAQEGAHIAVVDMMKDKADETARLIQDSSGGAISLHVDITDETAVREHISSTTDSERHFLALLSIFEQMAPVEAFRIHMNTLRQQLQSTSLNCLLLTPGALYAAYDFDPNATLARKDPNYFHLHYQATPDAVIVASTDLGQDEKKGWQTLKNGHMLIAERGTLKATIHAIAHNARSSIQERYLSQLQR